MQTITTITIDPTQSEVQRQAEYLTRNSKDIKTTPITAEQYLRDQLTQHTDDPVNRILKMYETLFTDKVQSNITMKTGGKIHKHSDIQISNTQGHTINIVPSNIELTENSEQTVSD